MRFSWYLFALTVALLTVPNLSFATEPRDPSVSSNIAVQAKNQSWGVLLRLNTRLTVWDSSHVKLTQPPSTSFKSVALVNLYTDGHDVSGHLIDYAVYQLEFNCEKKISHRILAAAFYKIDGDKTTLKAQLKNSSPWTESNDVEWILGSLLCANKVPLLTTSPNQSFEEMLIKHRVFVKEKANLKKQLEEEQRKKEYQ